MDVRLSVHSIRIFRKPCAGLFVLPDQNDLVLFTDAQSKQPPKPKTQELTQDVSGLDWTPHIHILGAVTR